MIKFKDIEVEKVNAEEIRQFDIIFYHDKPFMINGIDKYNWLFSARSLNDLSVELIEINPDHLYNKIVKMNFSDE